MAESDFSELELEFAQPTPGNYVLGLRFHAAGSDADRRLPPS
jgi:hypothetical protein